MEQKGQRQRGCVILVDNSNVFIGGKQYSAEQNGGGTSDGHSAPIDPDWRIDYSKLRQTLAKGRPVHAAIMVGSTNGEHHGPWDAARACGFEVIVQERDAHHGEKCVDTELVVRGTELVATAEEPLVLVIASGDRDFVPLVEVAHRHGWEAEMCAFSNSFKPDGELAQAVDRVRPLDDVFEKITYRSSHLRRDEEDTDELSSHLETGLAHSR